MRATLRSSAVLTFLGFLRTLPAGTFGGAPEQSILVTLPNIPNTGTCQLRKGRYSERDRIYHITTGTCDRVPVFSNFRNGRILVRSLQQQQDHGHLESLAFVVMPDHLHWLLQLTGKRTLSSCINFVKSLSAREIRMAQGLDAAVWQRGFHDRAIRREDDLIHVARYIIANPLRAGIVDSVRDYPLWDAKWV